MLVEKIMDAKASKRKLIPVNSNWASQLGEECERLLVLSRTSWEQGELPSLDLQCRFDVGNTLESQAMRDLEDALGKRVILSQQPFTEKRANISGRIDGVVEIDGKKYPLEIKSMADAIWNQFSDDPHDLTDFEKYPWTKKYVPQMQLYLYLAGYEEGVLLLLSLNGRYKEKIIKLDYDAVDALIKKAERVNGHVANGTLPDYSKDAEKCLGCRMFTVCKPPMDYGAGPEIINDAELAACLKIYSDTKTAKSDYERAYERIKGYVGKRPIVLCGEWQITRKENKAGSMMTKITKAGEVQAD